MIEHLIKEINDCLENDCQIAALTLALTLPDTCGKICYPQMGNKQRYVAWYDNFVNALYHNCQIKPNITGEIIYRLRCALLHESNPTISGTSQNITSFALIWSSPQNLVDTYSEDIQTLDATGNSICHIKNIHIVTLCRDICSTALMYYQENKDAFDSVFTYRIISCPDGDAMCRGIYNAIDI